MVSKQSQVSDDQFKKKKNEAYLLYIGFPVMDYVMVLVRLERFPL